MIANTDPETKRTSETSQSENKADKLTRTFNKELYKKIKSMERKIRRSTVQVIYEELYEKLQSAIREELRAEVTESNKKECESNLRSKIEDELKKKVNEDNKLFLDKLNKENKVWVEETDKKAKVYIEDLKKKLDISTRNLHKKLNNVKRKFKIANKRRREFLSELQSRSLPGEWVYSDISDGSDIDEELEE